jgi:MinD-like ATPase involved in chromosome partitioning or flagellar assembly
MSKIISIHSFRGGTGKSNLTANLAAQVAISGKRVAVVDTDIQSPGIHVLFGLDENSMQRTLNEFLHGQIKIEQAAFHIGQNTGDVYGRKHLAGKDLWLLPASINGNEISQILRNGYDVNLLNDGLHEITQVLDLDYLFIDTHPGLNEETLLSIVISDTLILILRPDQQDFQGTAVTIDIARLLDVPEMFLVVNKALSKYEPTQIKNQVEDTYNCPVAGVLPLSEELVDNASNDIFSLAFPEHPWSQQIGAIVATLMKNA